MSRQDEIETRLKIFKFLMRQDGNSSCLVLNPALVLKINIHKTVSFYTLFLCEYIKNIIGLKTTYVNYHELAFR